MPRTLATVFGRGTPLRGRLTLPGAAESAGSGVVVVGPFGHPYICSYRPLRVLAERLAERGRPVLRFDWPGQGDSADVGAPVAAWTTWAEAVREAIAHLRTATGVDRVALVGLRLGATVALTVAGDPAVAGVVLLAPFPDGRSYLRETQVFEALTGMGAAPRSGVVPDGALEAAGFLIDGAEVAALRSLDARTLDRAGLAGTPILLAAPALDDPALRLREVVHGDELTVAVEPELTHLYEGTGRSALTPACRELVESWLDRHVAAEGRPGGDLTRLERTMSLRGDVVETGATIGAPGRELAVVTCEPGEVRGPWVVFLNAGAVHHVGPNRLWTSFGRTWAASGIPSARVDTAALGDSEPLASGDEIPGLSIASLYTAAADHDIRATLDWLAETHGAREFVLVGLCSGAYFSLRVGAFDSRVVGLGLINPRVLVWDDEYLSIAASHALGDLARTPSNWHGALRHGRRPSLRLALRGSAVRALRPGGRRRRAREGIGLLTAVPARGGRCHLIASRGDDSHTYLLRHLGPDLGGRLRAVGVTHELFDDVDHTFRPLWAHEALRCSLERSLALPFQPLDRPAPDRP